MDITEFLGDGVTRGPCKVQMARNLHDQTDEFVFILPYKIIRPHNRLMNRLDISSMDMANQLMGDPVFLDSMVVRELMDREADAVAMIYAERERAVTAAQVTRDRKARSITDAALSRRRVAL